MPISVLDCIQAADDATKSYEDIYNQTFEPYFVGIRDLYNNLQATHRPITDGELEDILTDVALQLFAVSEELSAAKLRVEVLKLQVKSAKSSFATESDLKTAQDRKDAADYEYLEVTTTIKVLESVIARVEREMTYARELVMSAKKIWSARKNTEGLPIGDTPSDPADLPIYGMEA